MHDPRLEGPMTDAALDREIEQLVAVEPPAALLVRVRERIATGRPPLMTARWASVRWAIGAGACVAVAGGVAFMLQTGPAPAPHRTSAADVPRPAVAAPRAASAAGDSQSPPVVPFRPSSRRAAGRIARVEREPGQSRTGMPFPPVIVSDAETEGLRQLIAAMRRGDERVAETERNNPIGKDIQEIVIAPIEIAPIEQMASRGVAE